MGLSVKMGVWRALSENTRQVMEINSVPTALQVSNHSMMRPRNAHNVHNNPSKKKKDPAAAIHAHPACGLMM